MSTMTGRSNCFLVWEKWMWYNKRDSVKGRQDRERDKSIWEDL